MKVYVSGLGAVGTSVVTNLIEYGNGNFTIFLDESNELGCQALKAQYGNDVHISSLDVCQPDLSILAGPSGSQIKQAEALLNVSSNIISTSDDLFEVNQFLELDDLARSKNLSVVVGAGFMPGISCLLVRLAAHDLDQINTIMVSKVGTAGPACARQHHRALSKESINWFDGEWVITRSGKGRVLLWFPEPIGAKDCYTAALPSPILLRRKYPSVRRVSSRMEANRRDRLTSRLPMLRPPHNDGGPGAVRAEVRGSYNGEIKTNIYSVMDSPIIASSKMVYVLANRFLTGNTSLGVNGVAMCNDSKGLIKDLIALDIKVSIFGS